MPPWVFDRSVSVGGGGGVSRRESLRKDRGLGFPKIAGR